MISTAKSLKPILDSLVGTKVVSQSENTEKSSTNDITGENMPMVDDLPIVKVPKRPKKTSDSNQNGKKKKVELTDQEKEEQKKKKEEERVQKDLAIAASKKAATDILSLRQMSSRKEGEEDGPPKDNDTVDQQNEEDGLQKDNDTVDQHQPKGNNTPGQQQKTTDFCDLSSQSTDFEDSEGRQSPSILQPLEPLPKLYQPKISSVPSVQQQSGSLFTHSSLYQADRRILQPLNNIENQPEYSPISRPIPMYDSTSSYMGMAYRTLYDNYSYGTSSCSNNNSYQNFQSEQSFAEASSSCHSCCHLVKQQEQRIKDLESAFQSLKQKKKSSKDMKEDKGEKEKDQSDVYTDMDDLRAGIATRKGASDALLYLFKKLFTIDELTTRSVMGANSKKTTKPGLNPDKRTMIEALLIERFDVPITQLHNMMRDRLKLFRMKYLHKHDKE